MCNIVLLINFCVKYSSQMGLPDFVSELLSVIVSPVNTPIKQYLKIYKTSNVTVLRNSACVLQFLLMASLPHLDNDLEYSSYSLNMELIPGIDLFSDQGLVSNTVASLDFLCHWLYTSGHHLTVRQPHAHL